MRCKHVLFLAASLLFAGGCASITRGTMDSLVVESDPSGAEVEVHRADRDFTEKEVKQNTVSDAGAIVGMTPSSFRLKREGTYRVVVSKAGFETVESAVSHSVAGGGAAGMAGNVLLGGAIGMVVDSNTGAMLNLSPNPLTVILVPEGASSDAGDDASAETLTESSDEEDATNDNVDAILVGGQKEESREPATDETEL